MIKRFCERCERITENGHLWCQERDCPAEEGYPVFDYGDYLGDLKITKLIGVTRTCAMYKASRGVKETEVFLKVAHANPECEERLKREASLLNDMAPFRPKGFAKFIASFRPTKRSNFPVSLPPYPTPSKRPFGEISFRGVPRVYAVYEPVPGNLISEMILENPQAWHYEVAWVVAAIADALAPVTQGNLVHLSLTPHSVMVDVDKDGHWRPTLVDFGWMIDRTTVDAATFAAALARSEPAYTAPEVTANRVPAAATPAADVYSLGLILFEMLAGRPAFPAALRGDEGVRARVVGNKQPLMVARPELEGAGVVSIVDRSLSLRERFATVADLGKAITTVYSTPPVERRPTPKRYYFLMAVVYALLIGVILGVGFVLINTLTAR